jgi:hypothetical protein
MPMPPYQVFCSTRDCKHLAIYKIAARWSDGVVSELKTYALSCEEHLRDWFTRSRQKQKACHLTAGETLEPPGVFHLVRGQRDQALERLTAMEQQLGAPPE